MGIINSQPPLPIIKVDGQRVVTGQGSYCWSGLLNVRCVDMISPPDLIEHYGLKPVVVSPGAEVIIDFRRKPKKDTLSARLWFNDEIIDVNLHGNSFKVPTTEGIYVYDIAARWGKGSSSYAFIIEVKE